MELVYFSGLARIAFTKKPLTAGTTLGRYNRFDNMSLNLSCSMVKLRAVATWDELTSPLVPIRILPVSAAPIQTPL